MLVTVAIATLGACSSDDGGRGPAANEDRCASIRVDAAAWQRAGTEEDDDGLTGKQRIADALVACETLIGMSRSEIRRILGPPDEREARRVEYGIGRERGAIRMDGEYLDIRFDADGRVVDAVIDS